MKVIDIINLSLYGTKELNNLENINLNIEKEDFDILNNFISGKDIKINDTEAIYNKQYISDVIMKVAKLMDCYYDLELKNIREQLKLPINKQLYYYDIDNIKHDVYRVIINEKHKSFRILEVFYEDKSVLIHEDYFRQMQNTNFEKIIEENSNE